MSPGDRADVERFAVGGWVDPPMSLVWGRLLLLGDVEGRSLLYVGHVRLDAARDAKSDLWAGMDDLEDTHCPFAVPPPVDSVHWCRPGVAVGVRFDGRNAMGRLRMPSLDRRTGAGVARTATQPTTAPVGRSSRRG